MFRSDSFRDLFAIYCDERRDASRLHEVVESSATCGGGRRDGHGVYKKPRIQKSFDDWMRDEGIRLEVANA